MKKTLIMLLMAGSMAFGTTLSDATFVLEGGNYTTSTTFPNYQVTVAMQLDMDKLVESLTLNAGNTNVLSWTMSTQDGTSSNNAIISVYGSDTTAGFKTVLDSGDRSLSQNTDEGHNIHQGLDSVTWGNITGAALTVVLNNAQGTTGVAAFLTLQDNTGAYSEYYGADKDLKWSERTLENLAVNGDIVNKAYVYNSALTMATSQMLNKELIPEPATATLSLLALCGLAARRRRK